MFAAPFSAPAIGGKTTVGGAKNGTSKPPTALYIESFGQPRMGKRWGEAAPCGYHPRGQHAPRGLHREPWKTPNHVPEGCPTIAQAFKPGCTFNRNPRVPKGRQKAT